MKKREENYFITLIFFALGYFFGFCLVGIILYPIVKFDDNHLEYAMKNGMISGFCVSVLLLILMQF